MKNSSSMPTMDQQTSNEKVLSQLQTIFAKNKDLRICVVGASCIGKTTLVRDLPECIDHDYIVWELMPKDIAEKLKTFPEPWSEAALDIWKDCISKTHFNIKPRQPIFSYDPRCISGCDLIIHLVLDDSQYLERVAKRGKNSDTMLRHKQKVNESVKNASAPVIVIDLGS